MIHLTGRAYALSTAVAVLGIWGQWMPGADWRNVWTLPCAALLAALLIEGLQERRRNLALRRVAPQRAFLSRVLQATLLCKNPQGRPLRVLALQPLPEALDGERSVLAFSPAPGAEQSCAFSATATALGMQPWPPVYARSLGSFGLAWWDHTLPLPGELEIAPDHLSNRERGPAQGRERDRSLTRTGTGLELLGLRDYQPNDSLRSIDWKASARTRRRVVRIFAEERQMELMLLIDAGRRSGLQAGTLTRLNHAINSAARLAELAIGNGDSVGLIAFADTVSYAAPPAQGQTSLRRIRAILGGLKPQPRESNPLVATARALELVARRALIVIYTDLETDDPDSQLAKSIELLRRKHLPVIAVPQDEAILALRDRPAENWLHPYHTLAANEFIATVRDNALRMSRRGAKVVLRRPSELDRAVLTAYERLRVEHRV